MSAADHGNTFSGEQRGSTDALVSATYAAFDQQAEEIRKRAEASMYAKPPKPNDFGGMDVS